MGNERSKTIIKAIIAIGIGTVSILLLSKVITFDALLSGSISSLRNQETAMQMLIVLAKDMSEALNAMSDISYKIMNSFEKIAPLLVVILGAVYFIEILLSYAAGIVFLLLIPITCIHYFLFLVKGNPVRKRKIFKGALWITVLLFVFPVSVGIADKMEEAPAYSSVETLKEDAVSYHNDSSTLSVPATEEEALNMVRQYLKAFGLLFITRVLLPLIFVVIYMRGMKMLLLKIPFVSKQLELPESAESTAIAESESVSEEMQPELEGRDEVALKRYKKNRLIRRIVFLVVLVIIVCGFKTGMMKLPDKTKKALIGTSVPLEYTEYTLQQGEDIELLQYKDFTVSVSGLENNEYGGHSLNITLSGNEYPVYITDVFVNGIEVMPGDVKYVSCDVPVRLYDEILANYLNSSCVSDIMFTVGLSGSEKAVEGTYLKTENVRLHVADIAYEVVDTSQFAEPLYKGEEIVIWNLGTGAGDEAGDSVNYCLLENQSDYDVYIEDNRAIINGELLVGEVYSGHVRSGQIGLILFQMENTENNADSPYQIVIEPEEKMNNYSSLFGEYYRNLWQYRDNYGKIDIVYY